ncbi:MAG TPA: alpha/beta fold hydrolase [Aggregatilineales bacterium]|nr:alpha/beta fold hydrolase [Aggregatilineales bacterium]
MANTVALHFTEKGQGTPIVLIHGFPLSSAIWTEQQVALSDHYHVITPDLRGYGQSPAPDGPHSMDVHAADVLALLDTLNIPKAVIIGHSMGGYVTLAAWRLAPERFLGLGLVSSQAVGDTPEASQGRFQMAEAIFIKGSAAAADAMIPRFFPASLPDDEAGIVEQVRNIILNTRAAGLIASLKGMAARPDSTPDLSGITVPVLILTGDNDQIIPPARAEAMAAQIPNVMLVNVEEAGHVPMLEQPHATTMAIRNFLATIGHVS